MAFLNKLGEFAKNAADKTGDMLEINRLNAKISTENGKIAVIKGKIGEYYWAKFEQGEVLDAEIADLCNAIKTCIENIAAINTEIKAIKDDNEKPKEPEKPATVTEPPLVEAETQPEPAIVESLKCSACGAEIPDGKKFCGECGAKY